MNAASADIRFRTLTDGDLPMLHEWLSRPHVAEWWGSPSEPADLAEEFGPSINGSASHRAYIVLVNEQPVGFMQSYVATAFHDEGWWRDEHDPGVRGIDQFLADADSLGRGVGTRMIRAFTARLFEDPSVTRIQTDPNPINGRAIRCYEKSGFRADREVDTPDGRALLMYCRRADHPQRQETIPHGQ